MELIGTVATILRDKGSAAWSIPPDATVYDAIQLMADKNVGALLVLEKGKLCGIVSERDYTRKVILKGRSSKTTSVRDIMTRQLVTISPSDEIKDCMLLMTRKRIRHLPVLEAGELVGILSIGDLVKWIMGAQEMTIEQLENYIVGAYPA